MVNMIQIEGVTIVEKNKPNPCHPLKEIKIVPTTNN